MYKTDINKINISSTNFIDTEKLNDLSIGEDNSELLVVNSDAIFTGTLSTSGGLVGGSSGGGGSGIVNNRIDGDLTICEDSSDLMVINSEAKFLNNVNIGEYLIVSSGVFSNVSGLQGGSMGNALGLNFSSGMANDTYTNLQDSSVHVKVSHLDNNYEQITIGSAGNNNLGEFGYSGSLSILFDNNISGGNSISIITTDGSLINNGSSPIPLSNNNRMAITIDLRQSYLLTGYLIWTRDNHYQPSPTIWSVRATNTHNTDPDLTVWTTLHSVDRSSSVTSGGYTNNNGVSAPNDANGLGVYPTATQLNGTAHSMTTNLMNNGSVNTTAFRYVQFVFSKSCPGVDVNGNTLTDYYQPGINFGEIKLFSGTYTQPIVVENIMINNISRAIPVKPVSGDAGKVLKANAAGTGLEYGTISKITGSIVQTQHTIYRDTYTKSANGWEGLPFFVSITPSSINSKILISTTVHIGADSGTDSRWYGIRLYKKTGSGNFVNFTNIPNAINIDEDRDGTGDPEGTGVFMLHTWGAGSADYDAMVANVSNSYLDTPGTTSAVEYKLYWAARLGEGSPNSFTGNDRLLLNRSDSSTDAYRGLPVSFIQAQEIYIP